jgi:patatin-like phospholipase/acyl hydrolase
MGPLANRTGRRRILSLDGGGVRGIFTIEVLAQMESLLRIHLKKPQLVLADHFEFMAGTSTGAIIASLLSWGESIDGVRNLYQERCHEIFPPVAPWRVWRAWKLFRRAGRAIYGEEPLIAFLKKYFIDSETKKEAKLGSKDLRTMLLLCMRNSTTGSSWLMTNNPDAEYNDRARENCNLEIPLWKLIRASTAAPIYFLPELIDLRTMNFAFVDGGMSPYNNPALIAFLMATQPCYRMNWPVGEEKVLLVSIGTGRTRSILQDLSFRRLNFLNALVSAPSSLMDSVSLQQDFLCRVMGRCLFGDRIDREVGTLVADPDAAPMHKQFSYVRYDHTFGVDELAECMKKFGAMNLANVRAMPFLANLGREYAARHVRIEHLV